MTDVINIKTLPTLLPSNVDFSSIFNNHNPLDLEIGCGRPHFFFDRALNFNDRNIIGIEYKYEFMKNAQKRIVRETINNALALHGNAWSLVPLLFKNSSLSNVFINFPDPWWKKKHKKRLILNEDFLYFLKSKMNNQSCIILQTDVHDLFLYYKDLLTNNGFTKSNKTQQEIQDFNKAKTHREKKCLDNNTAIYRGIFEKMD